ncbi:MAG: N-6 DNA methylase [Candidatus Odinarchaeota archaeon]
MPVHITNFIEEKSITIKKKDLKKYSNLKQVFTSINQHLYGKLKHTDTDTRARSKQIINLLLCKLVDEINKTPEEEIDFYIRNNESAKELYDRIQSFFVENVREKYKDVMDENEQIILNKELVYLIVKELQPISLLQSSKDILSDAFEIFVSKILKDEAGQFFTPANIVKFMVNYLDPTIDSKILDPACGHGGFLLEAKEILWSKIDSKSKKIEAITNLFGIDKDLFLAKISKLYLEILSNGKSNIFCEDSLDPKSYRSQTKEIIKNGSFDYIFTNPPFGVKIPINNEEVLSNYQLGHIWRNIDDKWKVQNKLIRQQAPQVLFIERCIQLLKDEGKLAIVLPEGIFGNPTDRYIWEYLTSNGKILGVVSLDQNAFQPFTCNKTSILFYEKLKNIPKDYLIDFAIIENVGHDKDGKVLYKLKKDGSRKTDSAGEPIINDDLINLHLQIKEAEEFDYLTEQKIFKIKFSQIKDKIFIPNYYTGVEKTLKKLSNNKNFVLFTIKDLVDKKIIYANKGGYIPRGDEIGSHVYGLGNVPFIRTSEINNWEINLDSYKKTSDEVYEQYKIRQNIEQGDVLLVKDGGPNLIGKTAYVTDLDTKIIIQSHIYQIKTKENEEFIDAYLMLYLLNLDIVQKQIQAITFVQGTIATIGNRILEVVLPIPSDVNKRVEISKKIKDIIEDKKKIRRQIKNLSIDTLLN